jgi:mono/diheme cytochrome c family protein
MHFKRLIALLLPVVLAIALLPGCYYDKGELVYPQKNCDTTAVTYSKSVQPIMQGYCYACHAGSAVSGSGIKLDTYAGLKPYADNGKLMNSILQNGLSSAMPKGAGKMPDCNIATIRTWVRAGAPNN